jgi:hypothetical protein
MKRMLYFSPKSIIMRIVLVSTLILLFVVNGYSQERKEHFRGGMLLHAGYLSNSAGQAEIDGLCTGIGGKMVFPVWKGIRIGAEGYVSNYNYKESTGFHKMGWGGVLAEYQFSNKKLTPVIGVSFGGGKIRDLYPVSGSYVDNDPDVGIYKVYPSLIIAPQFSVEYSVSSHMNLVAKADYLLFPGNDYPDFVAKGPRLFVGFLFSR